MGIPVKGFPRYEIERDGTVRNIQTGRILNGRTNGNRYKIVELFYDTGKSKQKLLHRLVAEAYIPNPNNLPCVNHKDENPLNNSADNLEWCTHKYNTNYGTCIERRVASTRWFFDSDELKERARINGRKVSKPVAQFSKEGELIACYPSIKEASRMTGANPSHISECCASKKQKTVGGYVWKYRKENDLLASLA